MMSSIADAIHTSLDDLPLDSHSCQLLGPTALIVQALMGVLAVLSLVYKRHRETVKRPWMIWLFDVSKQIFGQMFVHGLNVLISDLGSHHNSGNACTYYFLNILLDTTLGVGMIYLGIQTSTWLLSKKLGIKGLKTGQYGNPPSITYWLRQTAVYVFAITTMKLLVVALFAFWPEVSRLGDWILGWITPGGGESVQVIFVMGIFPIFMNIVQFWLIDSIVKASTTSPTSHSTSPRNSDSEERGPLFGSPDNDDDDVPPQDIETGPASSTSRATSEGDFETLVSGENDKTKLSPSVPSSPMTLPASPLMAVHDYPPYVGSVPQASTRSRHKHRSSISSLISLSVASSVPVLNTLDPMRSPSRQALLSELSDSDEDVIARAVAFESRGRNHRAGLAIGERWPSERPHGQNKSLISVR